MPRIALVGAVVCLLASCSDGVEPNPGGGGPTGPGDPVGLWDASISEIAAVSGTTGEPIECTAEWVMAISAEGSGATSVLSTIIPLTATIRCGGGAAGPWSEGSVRLVVGQAGDSVAFFGPRGDTLMVAGFGGESLLSGHTVGYYYPGARFAAVRRSGSVDPNRSPYLLELVPWYPDLEVGDSMAVLARVVDAYYHEVADPALDWSSSDPDVASVGADGVVHGVTPGRAVIRAAVSDLEATADVEVPTPAAAVEITQVPDSLIEPMPHELVGVARDGSGQVLTGRRFHWTSSDTAVATVAEIGEIGYVTTRGPGSVTITARSSTLTASATLTVLPAVAEIVITGTDGTVPIGGTVQLTAGTRDREGNVLTGRPVAWQSEAYTSISVDGNGLASGLRGGPGPVTARAEQVARTIDIVAVMDAPLTAVAAGYGHTCGLTETGRVYCWGHGGEGRLGPDYLDVGSTAVPIVSPHAFVSLFAGGLHTCALDQAGAAFCWGANGFGQLGQPAGLPGAVEEVVGGLAFNSLTIGGAYTCGLAAGQEASCWGANTVGQLGGGTSDGGVHSAPEPVAGGREFTEIRAGPEHACGLTAGGEAYCWGSNLFGMLGLGTADDQPHPIPARAAPAFTFTALAAGNFQTCGISTDGPVYCWGSGQLAPAQVDASTGYVKIGAGFQHFCRLDAAGRMSCWGETSLYNLGYTPNEPVTDFTAGIHDTCAVPASGKVFCWGLNDGWQLGVSTETYGPVAVAGQP